MLRRAFTLIELLVVIAIIAILAAILFPVFAQAKVAAKKAANISNHKQILTASLMYSSDYDDIFPLVLQPDMSGSTDVINPNVYTWQNSVQPYAKNWAMMVDPVSRYNNPDPKKAVDVFINYGMLPRAGTANRAFFTDSWYVPSGTARFDGILGAADNATQTLYNNWLINPLPGVVPSLSQTQIAGVASTILATDATAPDMWLTTFGESIADDAFDFCITWYPAYGSQTTGPLSRYNASDNSLCSGQKGETGLICTQFADGHVKAAAIGEVFKSGNDSAGDRVYVHMWPTEQL